MLPNSINLVSPNDDWPDIFNCFKQDLQTKISRNIEVAHIGSTAINGLKAKDIIDVQIAIESFDQLDTIKPALGSLGLQYIATIKQDHVPFQEYEYFSPEWEKRFFTGTYQGQKFNVHVRLKGNLNWHFALDFVSFLQRNEKAKVAYEQLKERLANAEIGIKEYCMIKDSVIDLMSLQFKTKEYSDCE